MLALVVRFDLRLIAVLPTLEYKLCAHSEAIALTRENSLDTNITNYI